MRPGLLVVLAVISILLLVPLWFAWLSTTPCRWARVERVLGKEYTAGAAPSWLWKVYAGLVPLQAVMALLAFGSLRNPMLGWLAVGQAVLGVVLAGAWFQESRRGSGRSSARPSLQGRAERGRPDPGVGGDH